MFLPTHESISNEKSYNLGHLELGPHQEQAQILLITDSDEQNSYWDPISTDHMHIAKAFSVEDGIQSLKSKRPDLIICDTRLCLAELFRSIKDADDCDIPLLLFSTETERQNNLGYLSNYSVDLVLKPCDKAELQARIRYHLQNYLAKKVLEQSLEHKGKSLFEIAQEIALQNCELKKINRLKDEFLAVLSHELRNPINVINGFAELLKMSVNNADMVCEAAEAIHRNAQIQIKIMTDLTDVSKGIAGKMVLEPVPVELNSILQETLRAAWETIQKKRLELVVHCDSHGSLIQGDPVRLGQVIWNLLSNAIKFTSDGGRIEIQLTRKDQWIEFSIQDSGVGIDPAFIPHMFEKFHQQDSSITKNFGGLGLGLSIAKHIVDLHGGHVAVQSAGIGCGSTFTVCLPAMPN